MLERCRGSSKWGVLAATFNPPTIAHSKMARWALEEGQCKGVLLLLDVRHAEKGHLEAHLLDRLIMAQLAFPKEQGFVLGISSHGRFLDKTLALKALLGADRNWFFLLGSDSLQRMLDPIFYTDYRNELKALFGSASFVVFRREGHLISQEITPPWANIVWRNMPDPLKDVSSTKVRQSIRSGQQWAMWVHPSVAKFIEKNHLYRDSSLYQRRLEKLEVLCSKER